MLSIEENVPLAPYATFGIGGSARFFVRVRSFDELHESLDFALQKNIATLILGGGSNMVIPDAGFDGLVVKVDMGDMWLRAVAGQEVRAVAEAGASWDGLVEQSVLEGLWGIENLSGIPGTVGGAVVGNIGAYGQALSQKLEWVDALDRHTGLVQQFTNAECDFGYRESFFSKHADRYVVVRAAFLLTLMPTPELSYKDLAERFKDEKNPALFAIREAVLAIRAGKFPDLSVEGTAGSFFKNPIVTKEAADALVAQYPGLPVFAMPETSGVKIPLAWLLDRVLNLKGFSVGGARLFEKQPLVVAAKKGTTSDEVIKLAHAVTEKVKEKFSISIEPEVKIIK